MSIVRTGVLAGLLLLAASAAHHARAAGPSAPTPPRRPHVFNLIHSAGSFESSPVGQRPGWRTYGFWSYRTPLVGDLLVKRNNGGGLSAWELETVKRDFTGSNGDQWWTGRMRDLIFTNTMQPHHVEVLQDVRE